MRVFAFLILSRLLLLSPFALSAENAAQQVEIDRLHRATQRLNELYNQARPNPMPNILENFRFNLVRMMVFDPDRGDPMEGRKGATAWQLTDRIYQEWLAIQPQLNVCGTSSEQIARLGEVVQEIFENRRRLLYRAARSIVRSGRFDEVYQALAASYEQCQAALDEEAALVASTQRRFRIQKLGLAIDDFFKDYREKYPEDHELLATQSVPLKSIAITPIDDSHSSKTAQSGPEVLQWKDAYAELARTAKHNLWLTVGLSILNFLLIVGLVLSLRRKLTGEPTSSSDKAIDPGFSKTAAEEQSDITTSEAGWKSKQPEISVREPVTSVTRVAQSAEPSTNYKLTLKRLRQVFAEVFESEEFLQLLVQETQTLSAEQRSESIHIMAHYIDSINKVLVSEDSLESIFKSLQRIQEDIRRDQKQQKSSAGLATLVSLIDESRSHFPAQAA